ncbi:glycosyltransferase [Vibrio sp. F13]|nr:glycosyltransferase [Vibrio sp. F13]
MLRMVVLKFERIVRTLGKKLVGFIYNSPTISFSVNDVPRNKDRDESDYYTKRFWTRHINSPSDLSVIYRVKDGEDFLMLSMNSVLGLASEIIVIDNGSTDSTAKLVKQFAEKNKSKCIVKYVYDNRTLARAGKGYITKVNENPELSLAKFYTDCFLMGNSKYLMKMDAHYILLPHAIDAIKEKLEASPSRIRLFIRDVFGRQHGFEPLIFINDNKWRFEDVELFEKLILPKDNKLKMLHSVILRTSILHVKRLCQK